MDLNIDELDHIYEALGCSISSVEELEAPRHEKQRISYELEVLKKKIGGEIEIRLKLRAVQSSSST